MDAVKIGQITNANVYLDGTALVGRFKDFSPPAVEYMEVKHETLGQIAVISLPGRTLKELTGKLTIDFLDPDLYPRLCNPTVPITFSLNSYVDVFDSAGLNAANSFRLVTMITMLIRKLDGKPFKLGESFEGDAEYSALRFVQTLSNSSTPLREIDVMRQVNNVMGQPVWPN